MHIEISPFGGSRFGGVVQLNPNPSNIDYFTIKSSWDYGVLGDVSLLPTLQAEFSPQNWALIIFSPERQAMRAQPH